MFENLKNKDWKIVDYGDKVIWSAVGLLLVFSLLGVFSTSTIREVNSITGVFLDYAKDVLVGVVFMYLAFTIPFKYYRGLAVLSVFLSVFFLIWASFSGVVIAGQSAGRWVRILGFSFQPSALALISMVMYVALFLEKYNKDQQEMKKLRTIIIRLWFPVMFMFALIVVHNLSTGLIFLVTYYALLIIGLYSWKHIALSLAVFALLGSAVVGAYKIAPDKFEGTRVATWVSRVKTFSMSDKEQKELSQEDADKLRQVTASKTAVALGVAEPAGPGKSKQKYFLSQADSDFIYAIIVEENGLLGGLIVLVCFMTIVIRVVLQVFKSRDMFSMLTLSGLLCVMMCQAIVHMGVVVGMIPVTGQNLPFISSGGTSILASFLTIGVMQKIISNRQAITAAIKANTQTDSTENTDDNTATEDERYAAEVLDEIQNKQY
ncbi:MAG: FtsW/RodA/SpoVE family cell cycle protein [Flavobacteriales bacterium]|nr:FtsW/RodA/SpoVE family cell cycle protein [Flavobacteriales bacterium]